MKVLYLGATGLVGQNVVPILQEKFSLTLAAKGGGSIAGMPVLDVDVTDFEAVNALICNGTAEGEPFDAIVNCVIADYRNYNQRDPEEAHRYHEQCIDINARGAYHIYEAAWRAKVPKVVYIGSLTAILGQPYYERLDAESRERPANVYASAKLFGEHVGRTYAFRENLHLSREEQQQMQVLCLRLGQPQRAGTTFRRRYVRRRAFTGSLAVDMRDIAQAIDCALHSKVRFGTYAIVSEAEQNCVDPELYRELGYRPQWKFTKEGVVPVTEELGEAQRFGE